MTPRTLFWVALGFLLAGQAGAAHYAYPAKGLTPEQQKSHEAASLQGRSFTVK